MFVRFFIFCIVLSAVCFQAAAQADIAPIAKGGRRGISMRDTLTNKPDMEYMSPLGTEDEEVKKFYDSLESKTHRNPVTRFMFDVLIRTPKRDTTMQGRLIDEAAEIEKYAGKTIGDITIERLDVFEKAKSVVQKAANNIHVVTNEKVIRQDLFYKPGDKIVPDEIVRNNQLLRSRRYISDMWIEFTPREEDTTIVDIKLITRDSWTIGTKIRLRNQNRARVEFYDVNFLGSGTRFGLQTNYDWSRHNYGGNMITYQAPNILGTFLSSDIYIGRTFDESWLDIEFRKDFYMPTDYEVGFAYNDDKLKFYQLYLDEDIMTNFKNWDVWAGVSKQLGSWRSSAFLTARYSHADFTRRPVVGPRLNPRFHDYEMGLISLGMYREKFYAANMIYGFGYKEYLPTGYRFDLTFGHNWGEFHNDFYAGIHLRRGMYTGIGYLMGDFTAGTYIERGTGDWWQSAVAFNARWFSNLFMINRTRLRQFITVNYTRGWNRAEGNNEYLTFTRRSGPRSIREYLLGHHRAVINTESVFFTPWQPMGFRVALFGYVDAGWLGFNSNIFKNNFYTSFGFGVRVRNDRFIFNTIQLRLGLAAGKGGIIDNRRFQLSSEQRIEQYRFIPTRPAVMDFTETQLLQ